MGVKRAEGRLETRDAERSRLERHLLLVPRVRGVVGRDGGNRPVAQAGDQCLPVFLGSQRRVHLHVGIERAHRLVGQAQVVRRHLRGRGDARDLRPGKRLD